MIGGSVSMDDKMYWEKVIDLPLPENIYLGPHVKCIESKMQNRTYFANWYPSDSEENYKIYKQNRSVYSDKFGYDMNKHGFRCDELETFNTENTELNLLVFGCSYTWGTGLPENETWPVILSKMLSRKYSKKCNVINLSIPGGSYSDIDRISNYIDMFKTDFICVLFPPIMRKIFINDDGLFDTLTPGMKLNKKTRNLDIFEKMCLYSKNTFSYEEAVITKKLECFAKLKKSKFFAMNSTDPYNDDITTEINELAKASEIRVVTDKARDYLHHGNQFQLRIALDMYENII